jgi:hypothetical protein
MRHLHRHGAGAQARAPYRLYRRVKNAGAQRNEVSLPSDEIGFAAAPGWN